MFKKKNLPLVIAFAAPLLMILFIAASVYVPAWFVQPKYNFIYTNTDAYSPTWAYIIKNGQIEANTSLLNQKPRPFLQLFVYDVNTNTSHPISFADAQKLHIIPGTTSPDGFTIEHGNYHSQFTFFWYDSYNGRGNYLVGQHTSKKLNLGGVQDEYSIQPLGWIAR